MTDIIKSLIDLLNEDIEINNESNSKVIDISTDEGYNEFNELLDELENTDNDILKLFGINNEEFVNTLRKLGDKYHNVKSDKQEKKIERKEINHSEEKKDIKKFNRPSELLTIDQKLNLHKLVQEYVDTMIKPYNNGLLTVEQINDAYAGLYEFGAWILNK